MASLSQHLILGEKHAMDTAHQAAPFAVEIGPHLFLKSSLVEVSTPNSHTQCNRLLFGFAGDILKHSDRRVNAPSFAEKGSNGAARAFGRHEDDIDVGWNIDFG